MQLTSETFLEYPYLWGHPDNYKKLLEVSKTKLFTDSSNPKLIFTLHMGCVDVMLFYVSDILKNLNIIFTATKNKHLDNFVKEIRESRGPHFILQIQQVWPNFSKIFLREKIQLLLLIWFRTIQANIQNFLAKNVTH